VNRLQKRLASKREMCVAELRVLVLVAQSRK
jgi:hypothetical protein